MVITSDPTYDDREHQGEPKKTNERKNEGTNCIKEDDDEKILEVEFEIDLKKNLSAVLEEIIHLKK